MKREARKGRTVEQEREEDRHTKWISEPENDWWMSQGREEKGQISGRRYRFGLKPLSFHLSGQMASWELGLGRQCLVGGVSFELWERQRNLYRRPQLWQSLLSGPLGQSNQATSKPSAELSPFSMRHPPLPSPWSEPGSPTTVQPVWLASECICSKHSKTTF